MNVPNSTGVLGEEISLEPISQTVAGGEIDTTSERQIAELEPVDRGWSAWRMLLAAFIFEAVFWGFLTSFGIFQAYYSSLPEFELDRHNISIIGTLAQGLTLIGAPFSTALAKRFHRHQKLLIIIGWMSCIVALFTASFTSTVSALIVTQGLLYGFGFVTLLFPILNMLSEWWNARKGMAFGLVSAASGFTGTFMPLVLSTLLQRYGYRITLRASAIAMLILTAPLIPLLKGRLPSSEVATQPRTDLSFMKRPLFWVIAIAYITQGLGLFIPPVFVPSYAESIGIPPTQAALLITVMAIAQTVGQSTIGWISDSRLPASLLASTCCIIAAAATAFLWGFGKSFWVLLLYSFVYGFFAYGFGTLRVAIGRTISSEPSAMLTTYSAFIFLQGIGIVLIGPVTAGLLSAQIDVSKYGAYMYRATVIFVAASSTFGGILVGAPYVFKRWRPIT